MGTKKITTTPAAINAAPAAEIETKLRFFQYGKRNGEICETFAWEFSASFQGAVNKERLCHFVGRKLAELTNIYETQKAIGAPFGGFSPSKPLEFRVMGTGVASFGRVKNTFGAYIKGKKGAAVLTREQLSASVASLLSLVEIVTDEAGI
jgi:hypothetical protein